MIFVHEILDKAQPSLKTNKHSKVSNQRLFNGNHSAVNCVPNMNEKVFVLASTCRRVLPVYIPSPDMEVIEQEFELEHESSKQRT